MRQPSLKKKLSDTIFLLGQKENAATILKAFDLFIFPSLKEGLSYTLLEAGSASLPVIATSVGGAAEIIEDMKSGILIKEKRPHEIANAILFLLDHEEKWREFGERLEKKVATDFTLNRMIRETVSTYKNVSG